MLLLFFALWSIMGLDTYCCLIFYGLTLIHLTGPLSQVIQIKCVMCIYIYIYEFIYIYIYIYIYVCVCLCAFWNASSFLLLESTLGKHTHTCTLDWILGGKERAHWSLVLGPSRTWKAAYWISAGEEMASHGMNQGNRMNFCY